MCSLVKYCFLWFLILCLSRIKMLIAIKEVIKFSEPSRCKNNEYFNTTSFTCVQCDVMKNLKPSSDHLKCTCNEISKHDIKNGYILCTACESNTTVTLDGKDCISCNNRICKCNTNEIQIDRDWNGSLLDTIRCLPCTNNTYPSLDKSKCLSCNDFQYDYYVTDINAIKYYTWVQNYCLRKTIYTNYSSKSITYLREFEGQERDSYYFKNELQSTLHFCKKKDESACEHLSNMCALSLYSNKIACTLFMQMQATPLWLFYNKNETTTMVNSRKITQKYSLLKNRNDNVLNFTIAVFSLRGNFKSIGAPNMPCNLLEDVQFGVNVKKKCKLKIKDLLNANVEFVYPYLTFMENEKYVMHALPIFIKNINQYNNEMSHWQLVRKFFFVDNISGFRAMSHLIDDKIEKINKLSTLHYMKSLAVIINVQEDNDKIFPPLLIIEYDELTREQLDTTQEITMDYTIKFTLTNNNISFNLEIIIGTLSGLALIFSGIKTWNYSKQHHISFLNVSALLWFFIYTIGAIGNTIILTLISLCVYLFIFYRSQTLSYILLLDDIDQMTIKIFTAIAFFFKFIETLGFLCQYWSTKIFFLDWEQPKATPNQIRYKYSGNSLHKQHARKLSKNPYKSLQTPSKIAKQKNLYESNKLTDSEDKQIVPVSSRESKYSFNVSPSYLEASESKQDINGDNNLNSLPISIWRTYFIANQWLKLQTERKISVTIQLLAVLCIFQILQLYPWILMSELTFKNSEDDYNFTLYYTLSTLTYVSIYCFQWLISVVFYERCVANKMQEFVNLCSIANISVFIFPFNYYGFYVHGRSVHGFADTDLPTLMNDLNREQNNLCAHRGLVPGTTQQMFVLSLTETFRNTFVALSEHKTIESTNFLKMYYFPTMNWEQNFNTQFKLKKFLSKFIDHCFTDMDYVIKEQNFVEKLFNIVCHHSEEKSVFYIDNNYSFNQVLLYGNEWLLATFEMSIFTLIIALCKNCTLAASVTTFISVLLTVIVKYNWKTSLNNKTLLNKNFFMR